MPHSSFFASNAKEVILKIDKNFDYVVGRLNRILYREKQGGGKHTKKLIKSLNEVKDENQLKAMLKGYLINTETLDSVEKMFREYQLIPFIGAKNMDKAFGNKDIVIGLKGTCLTYRVDYDEKKGLHINLQTATGVNVALLVETKSKRFGIDETALPFKNKKASGESYKAQFIKCKFWIKMTMGYFISKDDLSSAFAPFLKPANYDFANFKNTVQQYLAYNDKVCKKIDSCSNEKEFINQIFTDQTIRATVIERLINDYMNEVIHIPENTIDSETHTTESMEDSSEHNYDKRS